ncbi:hypothetical protein PFISCL1PPCAC_21538, partial [Pristionchus fissidentatus]
MLHAPKPPQRVAVLLWGGDLHRLFKSSHESHFPYKELFENEENLRQEVDRMRLLKQFLVAEKTNTRKKEAELAAVLANAKVEIASKCTQIIAQAIRRCLDLMTQVEKVGETRQEEIKSRSHLILR